MRPPLNAPSGSRPRHPTGAVFFRRSRLFLREAAFFSGGEGCEWGAKQPTVGESGDKAENEFSGFIPIAVPRKGASPHIPASRLFVLFHPTKPTKPPSPTPPKKIAALPLQIKEALQKMRIFVLCIVAYSRMRFTRVVTSVTFTLPSPSRSQF